MMMIATMMSMMMTMQMQSSFFDRKSLSFMLLPLLLPLDNDDSDDGEDAAVPVELTCLLPLPAAVIPVILDLKFDPPFERMVMIR